MAKQTINSKEIMRTIRLKFLTDSGKIHTISLNCASAELAGAGGATLIKGVMRRMLEYDIFTVKLVKPVSAELIERRGILTPEDFQFDDEHTEEETAAPMVSRWEKADRAIGPDSPAAGALEVARLIYPLSNIQPILPPMEHAQRAVRRFSRPGCMLSLFFGISPPRRRLSKRPFWQRPCP